MIDHAPGTPEHCLEQVLAAWISEDWDALTELAQPSWKEGIQVAPFEQIKKLDAWIDEKGDTPIPLTKISPIAERRRIKDAIRNKTVGVPRDDIERRMSQVKILTTHGPYDTA
jgi:hypothetical protein